MSCRKLVALMARRWLNSRIDELEAVFDRRRADAAFLDELLAELSHRSSPRSLELKRRAVQARAVLGGAARRNPSPLEREIAVAEDKPAPDTPADQAARRFIALSQPVGHESLPARAGHYLRRQGVDHLGELALLDREALLREPNIGQRSVAAMTARLHEAGLDWGVTAPGWSRALAERILAGEFAPPPPSRADPAERERQLAALSIRIDNGTLPTRAANYLKTRGVTWSGELVALDPGEILRTPNMGRKSLRDLQARLAEHGLHWGDDASDWSSEMAAAREAAAGVEPSTDLLEPELCSLIAALRDRIRRVEQSERNVELVMRYLGWDGAGGVTLEEAAEPFGLTRERVRQIVKRTVERLRRTRAPGALLRAVQLLETMAPCARESALTALGDAGLTAPGFDLYGLATAAETYEIAYELEPGGAGDALLVAGQAVAALKQVALDARKRCGTRGCANLQDFVEPVAEALGGPASQEVLQLAIWSADLAWLDRDAGWFWRPPEPDSNRNRLANMVRKVLAVAGDIHVGELRTAVRRHHRMGGFAPPARILLELCRRLDFAEVTDDRVSSRLTAAQQAQALSPTESILAGILRERGPVLGRLDFFELATARGVNENSFAIFGSYSPILWRPAPGCYALVGAELPPGLVEAQRVIAPGATSTLLGSGWTTDGRAWFTWAIGRSALVDGILNFPAGYATLLQGEYSLTDANGGALGVASVRGAAVWKLRSFLRALGAESGDALRVTLDVSSRTGDVRLGGRELAHAEAEPPASPPRADDDE